MDGRFIYDLVLSLVGLIICLIAVVFIVKWIEGPNPYIGDKPKCIYCKGKRCFYCMYTGIKQIGQYKKY